MNPNMHPIFTVKKKKNTQQPCIFVYNNNNRQKRTYYIVFLLFVFLSSPKKKIEQYKVRDDGTYKGTHGCCWWWEILSTLRWRVKDRLLIVNSISSIITYEDKIVDVCWVPRRFWMEKSGPSITWPRANLTGQIESQRPVLIGLFDHTGNMI